jgi:hypothetical protein
MPVRRLSPSILVFGLAASSLLAVLCSDLTLANDKPAGSAPAPAPTPATEWSAAEILAATEACGGIANDTSLEIRALAPFRFGVCGAAAPVALVSVASRQIAVVPPPTVTCATARAVSAWSASVVQPAALKHLGSPVKQILAATSYECRNRYGQRTGTISEHAFANAVDFTGFVLADGRIIRIASGWGPPARPATPKALPTPPSEAPLDAAAQFLREIHVRACETFGTVLGPNANAAHHDHFHLDMKARRHTRICE